MLHQRSKESWSNWLCGLEPPFYAQKIVFSKPHENSYSEFLHCVSEQFNCYPVYPITATLTRADVNLIVNRKFAQTLEKKFFDATFAFSAGTAAGQFPSSDGWIEDLSDMTQGVGITQRVGDRIAPTSLEFRWLIFTPNAAGLITGLFFRMVIFIWTADGTPTIGIY